MGSKPFHFALNLGCGITSFLYLFLKHEVLRAKLRNPRLEHPPPRVFTISYTLYSLTITSYWSVLAPRAEWSLDNKIHFVSCTILKILPIDEKINYCQKWAEFWGNQCFTMIQSLQGSLSSPGNPDLFSIHHQQSGRGTGDSGQEIRVCQRLDRSQYSTKFTGITYFLP